MSSNSTQFMDNFYAAENWAVLVLQIVTISALGALLYCAHFKQEALANSNGKLSAAMQLFVISNLLGLITSLPTAFHKVFSLFDPNTQLMWIFWLYALNGLYQRSIGAFFVLCLTMERILLFSFPVAFLHYRHKYIGAATLATLFFFALGLYFYTMELPLDSSVALACSPTICITPKYKLYKQNGMKIVFTITNLISSIFFLALLKKKDASKKINNRSVKFTIIVEFIFDIVPSVCDYIVTLITNKAISQFVGPLPLVLINFGLALCSLYYARIYLLTKVNGPLHGTTSAPGKMAMRKMTIKTENPTKSVMYKNNWKK